MVEFTKKQKKIKKENLRPCVPQREAARQMNKTFRLLSKLETGRANLLSRRNNSMG